MLKLELLKIRIKSRLRFNLFVGIAALSFAAFNVYDLVLLSNNVGQIIYSSILLAASLFILAFNVYFMITTMKDLKALKKNKYEKVTARFMSFQSKSVKKGTNQVSYSGQVFRNIETNQNLILDVDRVDLKETYQIAYGRHSKIGIVISKV